MKLLVFPKYTQKGPSSRYRIYQYLPYFTNYDVKIYSFFDNSYTPRSFKSIEGIKYVFKCYLKRFKYMLKINSKSLVFVQYEFTPFLPFNILFFKVFKIKYIVDYDDAVFHDYDQHKNKIIRTIFKFKIAHVIKHANFVITGSPYLTKYALKYNKNVVEIPTSIDLSNYSINKKNKSSKFIIGWIGSKTTSVNLIDLIPVFEKLQVDKLSFEVRCIGFDNELYDKFKHLPFKIIEWSQKTEAVEIQKFNVGIMPLEDKAFNKGKCAFKLIQYMASEIPTISTPLEANIKVNRNNGNLFAVNNEEWYKNFNELYNNELYFIKIGEKNREIVERFYSIQNNHNSYLKLINELL